MRPSNKLEQNIMNNFILDIEPLLTKDKYKPIKKPTQKETLKLQPWKLKLNYSKQSITFHKTREKLITHYNNLELLGSADIYKGYLNEYGMLRYKHHSYFKGED